jgi:hypothetical protein
LEKLGKTHLFLNNFTRNHEIFPKMSPITGPSSPNSVIPRHSDSLTEPNAPAHQADWSMTPSAVSTDWVESLATANPSSTSYTPVKRPRANDSSESGRDYATMSQRELIDMVKGLQEQNLILTRLLDRATALQSFKPNQIATLPPPRSTLVANCHALPLLHQLPAYEHSHWKLCFEMGYCSCQSTQAIHQQGQGPQEEGQGC